MLGLPPVLAFMGDTQLRKKAQWEIRQPDDVFSENPVKVDFTGLLQRGVCYSHRT